MNVGIRYDVLYEAYSRTHLSGYAIDSILGTNDHDAVAHLQRECGRGEEIHAMTGHTGDVHAVHT